jgi:hypothetical protein
MPNSRTTEITSAVTSLHASEMSSEMSRMEVKTKHTIRPIIYFVTFFHIYQKLFKFSPPTVAEKLRSGYSTWLGSGGRGILEAH